MTGTAVALPQRGALSPTGPRGSGCSTAAMPSGASASRTSTARSNVQAPLASSRSETSAPTASRTAGHPRDVVLEADLHLDLPRCRSCASAARAGRRGSIDPAVMTPLYVTRAPPRRQHARRASVRRGAGRSPGWRARAPLGWRAARWRRPAPVSGTSASSPPRSPGAGSSRARDAGPQLSREVGEHRLDRLARHVGTRGPLAEPLVPASSRTRTTTESDQRRSLALWLNASTNGIRSA